MRAHQQRSRFRPSAVAAVAVLVGLGLVGCGAKNVAPSSTPTSAYPTAAPIEVITALPATVDMLTGQVLTVQLPQADGYSWKIKYARSPYSRTPDSIDVSFSPPRTVPSTGQPGSSQTSQSYVFARDVGQETLNYTYSGPSGTDPEVKTLTINVTGDLPS